MSLCSVNGKGCLSLNSPPKRRLLGYPITRCGVVSLVRGHSFIEAVEHRYPETKIRVSQGGVFQPAFIVTLQVDDAALATGVGTEPCCCCTLPCWLCSMVRFGYPNLGRCEALSAIYCREGRLPGIEGRFYSLL